MNHFCPKGWSAGYNRYNNMTFHGKMDKDSILLEHVFQHFQIFLHDKIFLSNYSDQTCLMYLIIHQLNPFGSVETVAFLLQFSASPFGPSRC